MLHQMIESQRLDPRRILRSMAQSTAMHADVPYVGDHAIEPLIKTAIYQMSKGNATEALITLIAVMFQQAYQTDDIALADRALRVWSGLLGVERDAIIEAIVAMHAKEDA